MLRNLYYRSITTNENDRSLRKYTLDGTRRERKKKKKESNEREEIIRVINGHGYLD